MIQTDTNFPVPTQLPPPDVGRKTSEFFAMLGVILANIVAVLVLFGMLSSSDAESVNAMIAKVLAGFAITVPNIAGLWKYISSRTEIKTTQAHVIADIERMKFSSAEVFEKIKYQAMTQGQK